MAVCVGRYVWMCIRSCRAVEGLVQIALKVMQLRCRARPLRPFFPVFDLFRPENAKMAEKTFLLFLIDV
jgi:hypothetical protein